MSKRSDFTLLRDIQEAAKRIFLFTRKIGYEKFSRDIKTQDAVIHILQIIGEAASRISKESKDKYKEISWRKIIGLRNKIVHDYSGMDFDIIWEILEDYLPDLAPQIDEAVKKEKE